MEAPPRQPRSWGSAARSTRRRSRRCHLPEALLLSDYIACSFAQTDSQLLTYVLHILLRCTQEAENSQDSRGRRNLWGDKWAVEGLVEQGPGT